MSSIEQQQLELKTLGNQALSNGKAAEALEFFTQAIDLGGSDAASRAILYSNRAACQMKLGDFSQALSDAETCIRLDSDFPKGWSRKASALFSLGQLKEAKACFEAAATKAKTDSDAKSYREWAAKCEERLPANYTRAYPSTSSVSMLPMPVLLLRLFSLLASFYWMFTQDTQAYQVSMYLLLASVVAQVFQQCGRPKLSTAYLETIVRCEVKPSFYLVLTFASMAANLPAVASVQLYDLMSFAKSLNVIMARFPPASRLQTMVFDSPQLERVLGVDNWRALSTQDRFAKVDDKLNVIATRFQLSVLLTLVFQLLTPAASPVSLILYVQVLKLRFLSHEQTKLQVSWADQYVGAFSQRHPLLNKVYTTIRRGVVYVLKPREQQ
ncbi:hypothetical protein BASA81_006166 [Batrachochytrium salamandrivorans]|nr:hypothetical protein BASA81_006166 [Batrachochytrium salamandrivorans]